MAHVTITLFFSRSYEMLTQPPPLRHAYPHPPTTASPPKRQCQSSEDSSCEDMKPPLPPCLHIDRDINEVMQLCSCSPVSTLPVNTEIKSKAFQEEFKCNAAEDIHSAFLNAHPGQKHFESLHKLKNLINPSLDTRCIFVCFGFEVV